MKARCRSSAIYSVVERKLLVSGNYPQINARHLAFPGINDNSICDSGGTWHFFGLTNTLSAIQGGRFPLRACTCISGFSFGSSLDGRKHSVICPFDSCVIFAFEYALELPLSLNMFRASSYTCDDGIASEFYPAAALGIGGAFFAPCCFLGREVSWISVLFFLRVFVCVCVSVCDRLSGRACDRLSGRACVCVCVLCVCVCVCASVCASMLACARACASVYWCRYMFTNRCWKVDLAVVVVDCSRYGYCLLLAGYWSTQRLEFTASL